MPVSSKLLSVLEHRMNDFIESRTAMKVRPIVLSLLSGNLQVDAQKILVQRFVMLEFLVSVHQSDSHRMENCHICDDVWRKMKSKYESHAYEFFKMNQDLFAEIELSH